MEVYYTENYGWEAPPGQWDSVVISASGVFFSRWKVLFRVESRTKTWVACQFSRQLEDLAHEGELNAVSMARFGGTQLAEALKWTRKGWMFNVKE